MTSVESSGSVLAAVNSESKVGGTSLAHMIAAGAIRLGLVEDPTLNGCELPVDNGLRLEGAPCFSAVETVSAGDVFRAVALRYAELEDSGIQQDKFTDGDVPHIREILARNDIQAVLQTHPRIEDSVSTVAQTPGVIDLCHGVYTSMTLGALQPADGSNRFVVLDARNPVEVMQAEGKIGRGLHQVAAEAIVAIHATAPVDVAAKRSLWRNPELRGLEVTDPEEWSRLLAQETARIQDRRTKDRGRDYFPYVEPSAMSNFTDWEVKLLSANGGMPNYLHFDNGERTTLSGMDAFGRRIAQVTGVLSRTLSLVSHSA